MPKIGSYVREVGAHVAREVLAVTGVSNSTGWAWTRYYTAGCPCYESFRWGDIEPIPDRESIIAGAVECILSAGVTMAYAADRSSEAFYEASNDAHREGIAIFNLALNEMMRL